MKVRSGRREPNDLKWTAVGVIDGVVVGLMAQSTLVFSDSTAVHEIFWIMESVVELIALSLLTRLSKRWSRDAFNFAEWIERNVLFCGFTVLGLSTA
jgi:hypothetical protein